MERIALTAATRQICVERAAAALADGDVIVYPTDTLYGLGADALSDEAVDKVYAIKGRDEDKPIHCIVADTAMAEQYADVTTDARLLFERLAPGALTVVLKQRAGVEKGIARGLATIGIRIPKNDFCRALARAFGRPFTATSANKAGERAERSIETILDQLSYPNVLENISIDLAVDAGELPPSLPSTVVDMSGEEPVILREGAIQAADVWNAIRAEA